MPSSRPPTSTSPGQPVSARKLIVMRASAVSSQSGWSALKSVVSWGGRTFEIQVQPLSNFLHERERLTRESHQGFKSTRERVRDEVAAKVPLFGFYRSLLRWLLLDPSAERLFSAFIPACVLSWLKQVSTFQRCPYRRMMTAGG